MNLTIPESGFERQSWALAALASIVLHGLLFGSTLWFVRELPRPKLVKVQEIYLAENIPDAALSSPQPQQASPRQLEAPVKPVPPKPKPKPRPKVSEKPIPETTELPPSLAMPRPGPAPSAPSAPAARGRPSTSAPQGPGGGTGTVPYLTDFGRGAGPAFLRRVMPVYPEQARRLGQEGRVLLRLTIDERGNLLKVEVLDGAGFGFDEAAVEAVRRSAFRPASIQGKPVVSIARLPIRFALRK